MMETPEEFANTVIFEWRNDRQDPPRFLHQVIAENTTTRDAVIRAECAERAIEWCKKWVEFPIGNHGLGALKAAIIAEPKEGV